MESSQIQSSLSLPSLHANSLIWTQKSIPSQSNYNESHHNLFQQKTFKSSFNKNKQKYQILSFIKPDYGSLGQFITDINLNTDFLKQKKKKYDAQDQAQQKKLRQHLQNKNLNKILCNPQSNYQQRSLACKLLIQRSFQQAFGLSINQFYQQQIKYLQPQQNKNSNINLQNLSDALDDIINKSRQQLDKKPSNNLMLFKPNSRKNRSFLRDNTFFRNQKQNIQKKFNSFKNNYRSLQKFNVPQQPTNQFKELQQKYSRPSRPLTLIRQSSYSSTSSNQANVMFKNFQGKNFHISPTQITFNNLYQISNQTMLYTISKINFNTIQEFSLINTSCTNSDLLFFMLDFIASQSKNLKAFIIEDVSVMLNNKNRQRLSQKIKSILQTASDSLQLLKLNQLGLQTKDFCVLCLGIGSSQKLQIVEMKNNKIDESGKKSYEVITKFFKNLQINLEGNILYNQINKGKLKSSKILPK